MNVGEDIKPLSVISLPAGTAAAYLKGTYIDNKGRDILLSSIINDKITIERSTDNDPGIVSTTDPAGETYRFPLGTFLHLVDATFRRADMPNASEAGRLAADSAAKIVAGIMRGSYSENPRNIATIVNFFIDGNGSKAIETNPGTAPMQASPRWAAIRDAYFDQMRRGPAEAEASTGSRSVAPYNRDILKTSKERIGG
jgi:hypothetical protein